MSIFGTALMIQNKVQLNKRLIDYNTYNNRNSCLVQIVSIKNGNCFVKTNIGVILVVINDYDKQHYVGEFMRVQLDHGKEKFVVYRYICFFNKKYNYATEV
jgi:hypothetical protein|tara:strand:+ start:723 stop:1025 length:303 start_codon:yes stop_codon:yes gene_type:complete